jgi:hypothetical protein
MEESDDSAGGAGHVTIPIAGAVKCIRDHDLEEQDRSRDDFQIVYRAGIEPNVSPLEKG